MRILVIGAGVIGSLYAARLSSAGADVSLFARGKRLEVLNEKGLSYHDGNRVKSAPVNIIGKLDDTDIYDYVFVAVRYEQVASALTLLRENHGKNIILLSNAVKYDDWVKIAGNRIIPGFPGAGGDIRGDILYAKFGSKNLQRTVFGEISGDVTERIQAVSKLFDRAEIPFEISRNIQSFHITHAAVITANRHFYGESGMLDPKTARSRKVLKAVAADIKNNLILLEKAGICITPSKMKVLKHIPGFVFVRIFHLMLSVNYTRDVLLGNHARNAKDEYALLYGDFKDLCREKGLRS
ncbi:MAG: hypothetical protein LBH90_05395 [Tannerella sp.]|jgi:2-dehydropantoate 2-reductase|nr:hypothetical protein [Tannerella sp.]